MKVLPTTCVHKRHAISSRPQAQNSTYLSLKDVLSLTPCQQSNSEPFEIISTPSES